MTHRYLLYEYYKHTYLVVEIEDYQHKRFLQMYFDKIKKLSRQFRICRSPSHVLLFLKSTYKGLTVKF